MDKETDRFCGALLNEIADVNPQLSKQVTKRVKRVARLRGNKGLRKLAKAAIFHKEHNDLYQIAVRTLSRLSEWSSLSSTPKISKIYESVYDLVRSEPVPGSFESKYDYTQKPIPD